MLEVALVLFGIPFILFAIHFIIEKLLKKFFPDRYADSETAAKSEEFKKGHIPEKYELVHSQSLYSTLAMLSIPFVAWWFRAEITNQIGIWNKVGAFSVCVLLVLLVVMVLRAIIKTVTEQFPSMSNNIVKIMLGIIAALVLCFK